jgi:hypothetical protein
MCEQFGELPFFFFFGGLERGNCLSLEENSVWRRRRVQESRTLFVPKGEPNKRVWSLRTQAPKVLFLWWRNGSVGQRTFPISTLLKYFRIISGDQILGLKSLNHALLTEDDNKRRTEVPSLKVQGVLQAAVVILQCLAWFQMSAESVDQVLRKVMTTAACLSYCEQK